MGPSRCRISRINRLSFAQDPSTSIFGPCHCLVGDGKQEDNYSSSRGPCVTDSTDIKASEGCSERQTRRCARRSFSWSFSRLKKIKGVGDKGRQYQNSGCTYSKPLASWHTIQRMDKGYGEHRRTELRYPRGGHGTSRAPL